MTPKARKKAEHLRALFAALKLEESGRSEYEIRAEQLNHVYIALPTARWPDRVAVTLSIGSTNITMRAPLTEVLIYDTEKADVE